MSLTSYVQSFSVQAPTGRIVAGTPIELVAEAGEVLDESTVEVVSGEVDLQFVFKHVQLPAEQGDTPWPAPATATNVLTDVNSGLSSPPAPGNLEGWVATIKGSVPVGIHDIGDQVRIDFRWVLTDEKGIELTDVAVLDGGLDADRLTFALPPIISELQSADFESELAALPAARRIGVQLVVRGRVGTSADTGEVHVPAAPIMLDVYPIPLPSVAALFRDPGPAGDAVLLMVPEGSPFSSANDLLGVLTPLRDLLGTVNTAAAAATWATGTRGLKSTVDSLATRIPVTEHIGFLARTGHWDLGQYDFISRWHWDTDIEDRASACLVISATRAIRFFQHDERGGDELTLDAVPVFPTRFGGAVVRDLDSSAPVSEPPGCVTMTGDAGGGWDDTVSSYRWGDAG